MKFGIFIVTFSICMFANAQTTELPNIVLRTGAQFIGSQAHPNDFVKCVYSEVQKQALAPLSLRFSIANSSKRGDVAGEAEIEILALNEADDMKFFTLVFFSLSSQGWLDVEGDFGMFLPDVKTEKMSTTAELRGSKTGHNEFSPVKIDLLPCKDMSAN